MERVRPARRRIFGSPRRALARLAASGALVWAIGGAIAQVGTEWNTIGPPGGTVSALLTNPV